MWKVDDTLAYENETKQWDIGSILVKQKPDILTQIYFNGKMWSQILLNWFDF